MDRLRDLEVFLEIASVGSLAGAARALGMSAPAVTRALARLEDRLGATLIVRTTRSLSLTPVGEVYARHSKEALEAVALADAAVTEKQAALRGTLSLTAPRQFGRIVIAPLVADFVAQHEQVNARLVLLDRTVHLLEEGIDLAVRISHLDDMSAIARRLGQVEQFLVASPDYLTKHGTPEALSDLAGHCLVAFTGRLYNGQLKTMNGSVSFAPIRIEVDCAATALELVERGAGIAPLWSYQCAASLRAERVVRVLEQETPPPMPCHFIWPERRFENPLVRRFIDYASPLIEQAMH